MDTIIFLILQFLLFSKVHGRDCQGTFTPECQRLLRSNSKQTSIIECWSNYAYCKATDGTVFHIPGFECEHSTCPADAKEPEENPWDKEEIPNENGAPRKCFENDNDPLDIAYTSKYGPSWYNKIDGYKFLLNGTWSDRTINREHECDEQGFFSKNYQSK